MSEFCLLIFICCYISVVLAMIAFLPVPNRALILPSDGFGMSYCTRAERVKNLLRVDSQAAERAFEYLILMASRPDSKKLNLE